MLEYKKDSICIIIWYDTEEISKFIMAWKYRANYQYDKIYQKVLHF